MVGENYLFTIAPTYTATTPLNHFYFNTQLSEQDLINEQGGLNPQNS